MIYFDPTKIRRYIPRAERACAECGEPRGPPWTHPFGQDAHHPHKQRANPTTFLWRLMPYRRYADLQAMTTEVPQVAPAAKGSPPSPPQHSRFTLNPGAVELAVLLECLQGVEGLVDEDGAAVTYPTDPQARERWLSGLVPDLRRELAEAFSAAHELTETDRGN